MAGRIILRSASDGTFAPSGDVNPPSWYSSCVLSWDGDSTLGTNYAFDNSGTPIEGTINGGLVIHTDYGENSSNGAHLDAADKYCYWPDTGGQYILRDGPQTIWMRVWISAVVAANDVGLFEATNTASNFIAIAWNTGQAITGAYGNGDGNNAIGNSIPLAQWVDIAYSWDRLAVESATADHSAYNGASWETDLAEIGTQIGAELTSIVLGENIEGLNDWDGGKYCNVTQWAIVDGWLAAKPW